MLRYERQRSCFHPNAVGVSQFFRHQYFKVFFSKPREYWWIVELSVVFYARFIGHMCSVLFLRSNFCCFVCSCFCPHFCCFQSCFSHNCYLCCTHYHLTSTLYVRLHFFVNVCTDKIHIICAQTFKSVFQALKLLCILCNE